MLYWLMERHVDFIEGTLHFYAWKGVSLRAVLAILTSLGTSLESLPPSSVGRFWEVVVVAADKPEPRGRHQRC